MSELNFFNLVNAVLENYMEDAPDRYEYHEDVVEALEYPITGINNILARTEAGSFNIEVNEETGDLVISVAAEEVIARDEMKEDFLRALNMTSSLTVRPTGDDNVELVFVYPGALTVNE